MKFTAILLSLTVLGFACKKDKPADSVDSSQDQVAVPPVTPPAPGTEPTPPAPPADTTAWIDPGAEPPVPVQKAVAILSPTKGNKAAGLITFEVTDKGLKVHSEVSGLSPGKHAYHVHLLGDCTSDDGSKAGTHFHFTGSAKDPGKDFPHITGDLGDLEAGADGKAVADATIEQGRLHGKFSILGRSVIVHEKPNDHTQPPMGGAGGRLACGVIGLTE